MDISENEIEKRYIIWYIKYIILNDLKHIINVFIECFKCFYIKAK
ncbi:hypothetical protein SC08_Contig83orf02624 [Clostridium butyricum]|nr:hypothetical protein SC08_Contig83orf02624 [Clostridium butyricum]